MLGVIAADGDSVGSTLSKLNSIKEYTHFARELFDLSKRCVFQPLTQSLQPQKRENAEEWFHPFELITLGGDDLFLIVPADKVLKMVAEISKYWNTYNQCVIPPDRRAASDFPPPALSFGLLICPATFPLYFMHELAEQLLQSAKSSLREKNDSQVSQGAIDYLILKSSGIPRTEAAQIKETLYRYMDSNNGRLWLTERPYRIEDFVAQVERAKGLKQAGVTRTQRHALARSLRLGKTRSTMDVLHYWARRPEDDDVRQALHQWATEMARQPFPWRRQDRPLAWKTPLLDVLELMEWTEGAGFNALLIGTSIVTATLHSPHWQRVLEAIFADLHFGYLRLPRFYSQTNANPLPKPCVVVAR